MEPSSNTPLLYLPDISIGPMVLELAFSRVLAVAPNGGDVDDSPAGLVTVVARRLTIVIMLIPMSGQGGQKTQRTVLDRFFR